MSAMRERVLGSLAWQGGGRVTERALRFGVNLILARLLLPDDFGTLAIVLLPLAAVDAISAFAIGPAIIQLRDSRTTRFLQTAFTLNVLRSVILAALLLGLAPVASWYFAAPELMPFFLVAAVQPLITGLESPRVHLLAKDLRFAPIALNRVCSAVVGAGSALIIAWYTQSAWALFLGQMISAASIVVGSWVLAPMAIRFRLETDARKALLSFAFGAAGTAALLMLVTQSPALLLGRDDGSLARLGVFTMNARLAGLPVDLVLTVAGVVLIPTYSALQSSPLRLARAWLRAWRGIALMAAPLTVCLFWMGGDFPVLVWGEGYQSEQPIMRVLAINSFLSALLAATGPLFWGVGRPSIDRTMQAGRVVAVFGLGVLLVSSYASLGVALALSAGLLVALIIAVPRALAIVEASPRRLLHASLPALLSASVCVAVALALEYLLIDSIGARAVAAAMIAVMGLFVAIAPELAKKRAQADHEESIES